MIAPDRPGTPGSSKQRRFAWLSRDTVLLSLTSLLADVSTEMLVPVLPIYLTQTLKAGGTAVGLVEGVATATKNIAQGVSGSVSDRLRRHKAIGCAGFLLTAAGKPLMGLATAWPGVLAGRFVDRLGAGIRSSPRDALVAASAPESARGRAFGLEGAGDNAGAFLGPLLAALLLVVFGLSIRLLFFLAVIPGLLAFTTFLFVRQDPAKRQGEAGEPGDTPARSGLRGLTRDYWKYLLVVALFGVGRSGHAFLILQTRVLGASLGATLLIYAGFNLVAALVAYPAGLLSDRLGRRTLIAVAMAAAVVGYAGFAGSQQVVPAACWFAVYGIYQGIFRSTGKALASDFVPPPLHATAVGWYDATNGLCVLAAGLIAGRLWDQVGHSAVFLLGAASALTGVVALMTLVPSDPRRLRAKPTGQA